MKTRILNYFLFRNFSFTNTKKLYFMTFSHTFTEYLNFNKNSSSLCNPIFELLFKIFIILFFIYDIDSNTTSRNIKILIKLLFGNVTSFRIRQFSKDIF